MMTARILLLAISSMVALTAGEILARVTKKTDPDSPQPASLFLSSPHFRLDERGAVRHFPNEQVRLVKIYGEKVEYDNSFRTNNLGFVDHRDYLLGTPRRRSYAFVGDSFVYGMGADPWVPQLRDALRASGQEIEIYNLGVTAASIKHFRKLLRSVADELPITHIVALPISNDFYRHWWVPVRAGDKIVLCQASCDPQANWGIGIIDRDAPISALVARSFETAKRQAPKLAMWRRVLYHSELYLFMHPRIRRVLERLNFLDPKPSGWENLDLLDGNLEALAGIRADFPGTPITLVHFPEIDEVEAGRYRLDLQDHAARLDIQYFPALSRCRWSVDMYYVSDGHPNAKGYANMQRCLKEQFFRAPISMSDPRELAPR